MANFTDIFIRRPVLAIVTSLLILLLGIVSYSALTLREYPRVDTPTINIFVNYPGATAEVIESYVTTPIENAVGSVDGLDYISSESGPGSSQINVHFNLGHDVNVALADVSSKVSEARWQFPKDIKDPIISKEDSNSQAAMYLSFQSNKMSPEALSDYLARVVQPQLQVINGVGSARIDGEKKYAMRLWLNPYAMAAHNVTAHDISQAITSEQLQAPTGNVKNLWQQFEINAVTGLNSAEQFNALVIRNDNGQLTRISDIGRAELGSQANNFSITIDKQSGLLIAITPKSDANPLDISRLVTQAMQSLQKYFPADVRGYILLDQAKYIHASINEIQKTFIVAIIFVILIVFIFLGSLRILLVPAISIPLSIIGVFSVMLMLGYSLNTLTLLALVLAVGMVVDDAIVVLENIYRHICAGKTPLEAALIGAREIQFAIISITLTLAAVYLPIGFTSGLTKILFKEFAFTLAATVIISGFIALTLSPMMCAKIMTAATLHSKFAESVHRASIKVTARYVQLLKIVFKLRVIVLGILLVAFFTCALLYHLLPADLAPQEDVGWLWTSINAPAAANFEFTQKYADKIHDIFKHYPEIEHYGMVVGGWRGANAGGAFVSLKSWGERKRSLEQIIQSLQSEYATIPGIQTFSYNPHYLPGSASFLPIEIAVQSTGSYEELNTIMQKLKAAVKNNPHIVNVDSSLKIDQPQLDIEIDRDKAGVLGISMQDITDAINLAFGEPETAHFTINGRNYDVIPQLDFAYKDNVDAVNNLQLRTSSGALVPLSNLITLKEKIRPRVLPHFQQMRFANLEASLAPGYSIGEALKYIEGEAKKIMPTNMKLDYVGQSRQFVQAEGKMLMTFTFAVIFIFLVLAAQFESFRAPLIVMFTVPLSICGALFALLMIGGSLSIYANVGLVTLVGLISKHGILIVEFANQLRTKGLSVKEAAIEAAQIRLRPILMTTCAMIIGALPLALAHGAGAISRRQIGWVIVGGMLIGTIFTLFVIPVMYTFLAKNKKNIL